MKVRLFVAILALTHVTPWAVDSPVTPQTGRSASPSESRVPVGNASLYSREIGRGQPIIVLHGGPDFDHSYLLPDLDRLADTFRLIYYDQRGRGQSSDRVKPEDVSLVSDIDDLDKVRRHFQLESAALLGHSWGAVLALEYAIRNPARVSHLILMNPAPASASDYAVLREFYIQKLGADMDRQRAIMASASYKEGDPETVAARYRLHFKPALKQPQDYEKLMATMRAGFISQGKDGIVKARAVEDRLMRDTWQLDGYDLLSRLRMLAMPALVIYGDHDFIPADIAQHIAHAIPNARLVTLKDCGHFAYLECADGVRKALDDFFQRPRAAKDNASRSQSRHRFIHLGRDVISSVPDVLARILACMQATV
jgi:proline iminopeptidase